MKRLLASLAVKAVKWAVLTYGEGIVGAALERIRQEKEAKRPAEGPWTKVG